MKKILFIIICLLFITGCQKYNELNDLAIIKSIGIKKEENYIIYAEIIDEIDKDNNPKTKIIEANASEISELFENIKILVNKEIYLSHIDLIILDENLKDYDYKNIINYFIQHKEFRNDFLVVLSSDIKTILEKSKYDEIEELIMTNKESKEIIKVSFEEIIQNFLDNKPFYLSKVIYSEKIMFDGNYKYFHQTLERIQNEERKN